MKTTNSPDFELPEKASFSSLEILDSNPKKRFDRVTRMAKRLFAVPTALVRMIDDDHHPLQVLISQQNPSLNHDLAVGDDSSSSMNTESKPFIIYDTQKDDRLASIAFFSEMPDARFFAEMPIRSLNNEVIGTICIIDTQPREFGEEDVSLLIDLAGNIEREIAAVHLATMDELTGVYNRRGFDLQAEYSLALCERMKTSAVLVMFDLNDFKPINDQFGHAVGDQVLKVFSYCMRNIFRSCDLIGRLGGDEFAVLLVNAENKQADDILKRLSDSVAENSKKVGHGVRISYSAGTAGFNPEKPAPLNQLAEVADMEMYRAKKRLKEEKQIAR